MTDQGLMIILSIVGTFITIGLGVIASLYKSNNQILSDLHSVIAEVQKEVAVLIAGNKANAGRMTLTELKHEKVETEISGLRNRNHEISNELNQLALRFELSFDKIKAELSEMKEAI